MAALFFVCCVSWDWVKTLHREHKQRGSKRPRERYKTMYLITEYNVFMWQWSHLATFLTLYLETERGIFKKAVILQTPDTQFIWVFLVSFLRIQALLLLLLLLLMLLLLLSLSDNRLHKRIYRIGFIIWFVVKFSHVCKYLDGFSKRWLPSTTHKTRNLLNIETILNQRVLNKVNTLELWTWLLIDSGWSHALFKIQQGFNWSQSKWLLKSLSWYCNDLNCIF